MVALLLTFGLLIAHSTTLTFCATISNRASLASSPSAEDLETLGVEMSLPPDYLSQQMHDLKNYCLL
ncbi:hypothetical protein ACTXT7_005843 [Hymenolepis weldensis]